jgi:hypothetical protein
MARLAPLVSWPAPGPAARVVLPYGVPGHRKGQAEVYLHQAISARETALLTSLGCFSYDIESLLQPLANTSAQRRGGTIEPCQLCRRTRSSVNVGANKFERHRVYSGWDFSTTAPTGARQGGEMIDWLAVAVALVLSMFQAPLHDSNATQASRYSLAADEDGTNTSPLPNATSGIDPWGGV